MLSANHEYPSGYQLLPAAGDDAGWNMDEDGTIQPLDIYDPETATALGLNVDLIGECVEYSVSR